MLIVSGIMGTTGCDPDEEDGLPPQIAVSGIFEKSDPISLISIGSTENKTFEVNRGEEIVLVLSGNDPGGVVELTANCANGLIANLGEVPSSGKLTIRVDDNDAKQLLLGNIIAQPNSSSTEQLIFQFTATDRGGLSSVSPILIIKLK